MQQIRHAPAPNAQPVDTFQQAMVTHIIEPELQIPAPRLVKRIRTDPSSGSIGIILCLFGIPIIIVWSFGVAPTTPWIGLILVAILVFQARKLAQFQPLSEEHAFLENGDPKPALVTRIEPNGNRGWFQVTFAYETPSKPRREKRITMSREQLRAQDIVCGKTFTVLVPPGSETEALPYFLVSDYAVSGMPRTRVGNTRRGTNPIAVAAEFGVEPELFCAAPRRVVCARSIQRLRLWILNLSLAVGALALYNYRNGWDLADAASLLVGGLFFIAAFVLQFMLFYWIFCEHDAARGRFFLRNGFAVRATVVQCDHGAEADGFFIRFRYPRNKSEVGNGSFTVSTATANKLGGVIPGTTFTVLRHPTESFTAIPYFQIGGAEIPGAGQVYTTPPGTSAP